MSSDDITIKDIADNIKSIKAGILLQDIQDLSASTTNDLMNIRENTINQINGLMDYHADRLIELHRKIKELSE